MIGDRLLVLRPGLGSQGSQQRNRQGKDTRAAEVSDHGDSRGTKWTRSGGVMILTCAKQKRQRKTKRRPELRSNGQVENLTYSKPGIGSQPVIVWPISR